MKTEQTEPREADFQNEVRQLNLMLKQQHALVRFYEEKIKK